MQSLAIGASRGRWIVLLVVSLCFVAGGIFILKVGGAPRVGWMNVVFFGGCAAVFAWQMADSGPRLVFGDQGVFDRTLRVGVIEWNDIEDAALASIHGNPFVCLYLRDEAKYIARLSPLMRRMVQLNRRMGFPALSLNLTGVDADPEAVHALIMRELATRRNG